MIENSVKFLLSQTTKNISVLAATKNRSISDIKKAIDSGIKIMGENYVQEAAKKYEKLNGKASLHLIGKLQSNKVKKAVEIFDLIQTIDTFKIANLVNKYAKKQNKIMPVLIEINIAKEKNKSGCSPSEVNKLAVEINKLNNLKLKGLMTIAPIEPRKSRKFFKKTKSIYDKLKSKFKDINTLSMGMSDTYKIAIEEGATMIRIGTRIFGKIPK